MIDDTLRCSVDVLIDNFRDGLVALVPMADRILLWWHDENQHRDWEDVAEAVFNAFVRGPIESDVDRPEQEYPLPRYDIDVDSYQQLSWIEVVPRSEKQPRALVRFLSDQQPFDTVQVAHLDPQTLTPVGRELIAAADVRFAFIRRGPTSPDAEILNIEASD